MADGTALRAPAEFPLGRMVRALIGLGVSSSITTYLVVTVASLFAAHHWIADLVGNFRPHLAAGGAALAIGAAIVGWRRAAIVPLALAALHASWLVVPAPQAVAAGDGPALRLTTYNVLFSNPQFERSLSYLRATGSDVIAFQEADGRWIEPLSTLADLYPYRTHAMPRGERETALMSRWPITSFEVIHPVGRTGKPLPNQAIRVELDVAGTKVVVYVVHPPHPLSAWEWRVRNIYHDWVARRVAEEDPDQPVIVAGDFNQTPWSPFHREMLAEGGLVDTAPSSWPPATRRPTEPVTWSWLGIPIDHVLVTPGIGVTGRHVGPDIGSDHQPVTVDLVIGPRPETDRAAR